MVGPAKSPSPFLDLPPEIRDQVYGGLFLDSSSVDVQMLQTSQQIYLEAQPFLYKRPIAFASQFDLYDWVRGSHAQNLKHVQCIRFKLVDVISREGLPRENIQQYHRDSPSPIILSYEDDLARFKATLEEVPNLKSLTLYKNRTGDSEHLRDFHRECFAAIARQYPALRALTFYVDHIELDFLSSFRSLQSLRFTGFSFSSPKVLLKELEKLTGLDEIELFGPPPALAFQQRQGYTGPRATQSMTAEVVRGLCPLHSFTVCEIRDPLSHTEEVFVTKTVLTALAHVHGKSLRALRVSTDFLPSSDSRGALTALLSSAPSLQELELGWPGLDGKVLDALPSSLRRLQINVSTSALRPGDLADRLLGRRNRLPALADVVVRLDWRDAASKDLAAGADAAVKRFTDAGIKASRGRWYPIILDNLD